MANLTGYPQAFHGNTSIVDTSVQVPLGTRAVDSSGNEYIYLTGVASTVAGSWVNYDEAFLTILLVPNAIGAVAIAMAATIASRFGWYLVKGSVTNAKAATVADNFPLFIDAAAAGSVDDAVVAGDLVVGAWSRSATVGGVITAQIDYPEVTNILG